MNTCAAAGCTAGSRSATARSTSRRLDATLVALVAGDRPRRLERVERQLAGRLHDDDGAALLQRARHRRRLRRRVRRARLASRRTTRATATASGASTRSPLPASSARTTWPPTTSGRPAARRCGTRRASTRRPGSCTSRPGTRIRGRAAGRRQPVHVVVRRAEADDRRVRMALPGRPPRHLGLRLRLEHGAVRDHDRPRARRSSPSRARPAGSTSSTRKRQPRVADRGEAGAAEPVPAHVADAADPVQRKLLRRSALVAPRFPRRAHPTDGRSASAASSRRSTSDASPPSLPACAEETAGARRRTARRRATSTSARATRSPPTRRSAPSRSASTGGGHSLVGVRAVLPDVDAHRHRRLQRDPHVHGHGSRGGTVTRRRRSTSATRRARAARSQPPAGSSSPRCRRGCTAASPRTTRRRAACSGASTRAPGSRRRP